MLAVEVTKDEIGPYLLFLASRITDARPAIRKALILGLDDIRRTLSTGDSDWPRMAGITPLIAKIFGRDRDPASLLLDSGNLLASFSVGDPSNVMEVEALEGAAGSAATSREGFPYGKALEEGTNVTFFVLQFLASGERVWGGGGIPPRHFTFWHEARFPEIDGIFMDYWLDDGAA